MDIITAFWLVMLFGGEGNWTLRQGEMPVEFPTLQLCMNAGNYKMVDRRNKSVKLYCIEADDADDLVKIMRENFVVQGDPA